MKAVGMFAGGIAAYDAGKYTRKVMGVNAQNSLNTGVSERDRVRYASRMQMGAQLVDQGASGFAPGTGSALDAMRASVANRELDFAVSRAKASGQATEFTNKGFQAYQQGKAAMSAGILNGAAEIASEVAGAMGGMPGGGGGGATNPYASEVGGPDLSAKMSTSFSGPATSLPGGFY
jgi:hypothetical protein